MERLRNLNEPCRGVNVAAGCVCVYMYTCLFGLCLEGGGQHLWEQLEEHGEEELHERNDDENHEGHQTEEVSTGPHQLETQTETKLTSQNVLANTGQDSLVASFSFYS